MLNLQPDGTALFLDFDGTLVDIASRPDAVSVPAGLPGLLTRLSARLGGALAVVSGRPVGELDAFLAPARLPAAGVHGLEIRLSGDAEPERMPVSPGIAAVRAGLTTAPETRGLRIEDKGLSLAIHYRDAPERSAAVLALASALAASHPDLTVLNGKMVVEVKPKAASKASAVARFLAAPPFAGRRPVFVGDDVTDEDGMRAALARGGSAIKIGPGDTVAARRLADPAALRGWLAALDTLQQGQAWDV